MISLCVTSGLLVFMMISIRDQLTTFWFSTIGCSSVAFVLSYLAIGLSNPGFAQSYPQATQSERENSRFCKVCFTMRNRDIYHCEDCNICIEGYDHHCPWIGKCVGSNNICIFYFFLIVVFGTLILCLVGAVASTPDIPNSPMKNGLPRIAG